MSIKDLSERGSDCLLKWCWRHDWGINAVINGGFIYGLEDAKGNEFICDHTEDLYEWAGH